MEQVYAPPHSQQPRCLAAGELAEKTWHRRIMEYRFTMKKKEVPPFVTTWGGTWRELCQVKQVREAQILHDFTLGSEHAEFMDTGNRSVVVRPGAGVGVVRSNRLYL